MVSQLVMREIIMLVSNEILSKNVNWQITMKPCDDVIINAVTDELQFSVWP